jgi:hypothetical protein
MSTTAPSFPIHHPPGYSAVEEDGRDWSLNLSELPSPAPMRTFTDLGYPPEIATQIGTNLAVSEPFRVLNQSDTQYLNEAIQKLETFAIRDGRDPRRCIIRGAAYRYESLRMLLSDPELTSFVSRAVGYEVGPSSLPHQMAHINIMDSDGREASGGQVETGNWHIDQNPVVLVLNIAGMDGHDGGAFQFFDGTRRECLDLSAKGTELPSDRYVDVPLPDPGYGILLHGAYVMHRSAPMIAKTRRVSLVSAFEPLNPSRADMNPNAFVADGYGEDANGAAERRARHFEYARHKAWRVQAKLAAFSDSDLWNATPENLLAHFTQCLQEGLECANTLARGEIEPGQALSEYLRATRY